MGVLWFWVSHGCHVGVAWVPCAACGGPHVHSMWGTMVRLLTPRPLYQLRLQLGNATWKWCLVWVSVYVQCRA